MITCERCQHQNPPDARFCAQCGTPIQTGTSDAALKVVTALFCDVADSTALAEELDPEALREVLGRYFAVIAETIQQHGGTVQKYAGDAVLAVFGIPLVHEDDALRAVRAAVEIHRQVPELAAQVGIPIQLRTGINTGLVITDQGKNLALGDAVNTAARLEQAAAPGEILLGDATLQLVRDAVRSEPLAPLRLKGKAEPVPAHRLLDVDHLAPGVARRLDLPLVDRHHELAALRSELEQAVSQSTCRLLTVLGAAGVGKSRLAEELFRTAGEGVTVLRGRCLQYGDGITFWPLLEALRPVGEAAEAVLRHLSEGGAGVPEELFLEVRRLLEALAQDQPLILHVDDLQWAEPMLIELLAHLAYLSTGAPILILCTARPELLEEHESWSAVQPNATILSLESLPAEACERLLEQLDSDLDESARTHVIRTSGGNPLFVEHMALLAHEQGMVEVPMTIQSLLTARIERLGPAERELLAHGAVEGEVFHRSAVAALADDRLSPQIDTHLLGLVRKDLIRPHRSEVSGEEAYRFRHLLIRDVAYERLPRARRAELHERYASWLEQHAPDLPEHEELAGWHLEQAVRDRERARRAADPATVRRAAGHLASAARRAVDRGDMVASHKLLERALSLAPPGDPLRLELTPALVERLVEVGDLARADEVLSPAEREHPDHPALTLVRLQWMLHVDPAEAERLFADGAERTLTELRRQGDARGVAGLHMLGFWMRWMASRAMPAAQQARLAAEHAAAAGDQALRSRALGWYVATLVFGPADVDTMTAELERLARESPGPYLQAFLDLGRGDVARLQGSFDAAVALTCTAREGFRALGMATMSATCEQSLGWIELWAGRPEAARESLLRSDAVLAEFGERAIRSTTQAMLARACQEAGRRGEAARAVEAAEELSAPSDRVNFTLTHAVRAGLALAEGDGAQAERWARSGLSHALATDFLGYQALARLVLAQALAAQGEREAAAAQARQAVELFTRKGDRPARAAAETLLGELAR